MSTILIVDYDQMFRTTGVILILGVLMRLPVCAQENGNNPFYAVFNAGSQVHFGPTEKQAEISGGYDSISYDHTQHLRPGFKKTIPLELILGYSSVHGFQLESRLGYFKQKMGIVKVLGDKAFKLSEAGIFTLQVAGLIRLSDNRKNKPYGFYAGFSAGCYFPRGYNLDETTKTDFEIEQIKSKIQLHFSMDGLWMLHIGKKGLYFEARVSTDIPSALIGSIGKIQMKNGASYTINGKGIKMYSMKGSIGLGYRFGKPK